MKNFFKIHPRRDARGLIIGLVLILAIAFIVNLFGCGNDTVVNNNNGNNIDLPVYSIDSLVLRSMAIGSTDTTFNRNFIADLDSFKIQFTIETNVPNALTNLQLSFSDSTTGLLGYTFTGAELNESYMQFLFSNFATCTKHITLDFTVNGNGNVDKYLIFRNFKVFRIN